MHTWMAENAPTRLPECVQRFGDHVLGNAGNRRLGLEARPRRLDRARHFAALAVPFRLTLTTTSPPSTRSLSTGCSKRSGLEVGQGICRCDTEIHHDAANLASEALPRRLGFTKVEHRPTGRLLRVRWESR